jgi:hypothetical protein
MNDLFTGAQLCSRLPARSCQLHAADIPAPSRAIHVGRHQRDLNFPLRIFRAMTSFMSVGWPCARAAARKPESGTLQRAGLLTIAVTS